MILVLDIGNTSIHGGVFKNDELVFQFRKSSAFRNSSDETGVFLKSILRENSIDSNEISSIGFCSVVPDRVYSIRNACLKYFDKEPFELRPGVKTGLKILYRNPVEVGADRIANSLAGLSQFPKKNLLIVDFGTATTIDVVGKNHEYHGGIIYPGVQMSMEVLEDKTAKLPSVEIVQMKSALGKSTIESIQSGLFFGQIGVVKELKHRITCEVFNNEEPIVIATGGFSRLFRSSGLFHSVIPALVLHGIHKSLKLNYKEG